MSRFFKNWFSSNSSLTQDKKRISKSKPDVSTYSNGSLPTEIDEKEFNTPYDTKRKMFTSRSGRMKHNQKLRGTLRKDLFGDERFEEKTKIEYHVHGRSFTQELFDHEAAADNDDGIKKSLENIYNQAIQDNEEAKPKNTTDTVYCDRKKSDDQIVDMDQEIEQMFKTVLLETKF